MDAATWYDAVVAKAGGNDVPFDDLTSAWPLNFIGGAGSDMWSADPNDFFQASDGDDTFDGQSGFDRANYTHSPGPIDVQLADGTVEKSADGSTDTLQSIEFVTGTDFADNFDATGFSASSTNAGSILDFNIDGTFNEFEGRGGNDNIIGNGNTRVSYLHATASVTVDLAIGTADGDASVGHDTFTGVNRARGSSFGDFLYGSDNASGSEGFEGRGGDDFIDGRGGFDRAIYGNEDTGITVDLAAGTVVGGPNTGTDTLRSVEAVSGTDFADTYDATGFTATSTNAASTGVNGSGFALNEFEGRGGNDTITGNGNTRIAFYNATAGVTVDILAGTSHGTDAGDVAGVGTDTITGDVTACAVLSSTTRSSATTAETYSTAVVVTTCSPAMAVPTPSFTAPATTPSPTSTRARATPST